jgi:hypothetical protein
MTAYLGMNAYTSQMHHDPMMVGLSPPLAGSEIRVFITTPMKLNI